MSKLDQTITEFIAGPRGAYYYQFHLGDVELAGGNFYRIKHARAHLKAKLRALIKHDSIIILCLNAWGPT